MNPKRLSLAIHDKYQRNIDDSKDYPTLADLMKEQNVPANTTNTVHSRRDLDSLG